MEHDIENQNKVQLQHPSVCEKSICLPQNRYGLSWNLTHQAMKDFNTLDNDFYDLKLILLIKMKLRELTF